MRKRSGFATPFTWMPAGATRLRRAIRAVLRTAISAAIQAPGGIGRPGHRLSLAILLPPAAERACRSIGLRVKNGQSDGCQGLWRGPRRHRGRYSFLVLVEIRLKKQLG